MMERRRAELHAEAGSDFLRDAILGEAIDLIGIQCRSVNDQGVFRRPHGSCRTGRIPAVPLPHILQNSRVYSALALGLQLLESARGAGFVAGGDEELNHCIREYHSADIPPVQDRASLTR